MAKNHNSNSNTLCVTIPAYFKCPISLELMKSPVSLSTGITYDRASIQSWLDHGNTTCPATMQSLSSPSFVPNLTLHRLIHLWSNSHSFAPSPRSPSLSSLLVADSNDLSSSLKKIYDQVKKSRANRRCLDDSDEFLNSLVELMEKNDEIRNLELIFLIFELCDETRVRKLINSRFLGKFVFVLQTGSIESKIAVARIVSKISADKKLIESSNLVVELHRLVDTDSDDAIEAGLSALIRIATTKQAKNTIAKLGMVRRVGEILCNAGKTNEKTIQRSMEMMEVMATCTEGRAAISEDEESVVGVVRRLMKFSEAATEHGVTVLWSVCYLFRDEKVKEVVGRSNGLGKCLVLLQSNCKPIVKQMCGDLVKVLRVNHNIKSCLGGYDTKTTHIMPY